MLFARTFAFALAPAFALPALLSTTPAVPAPAGSIPPASGGQLVAAGKLWVEGRDGAVAPRSPAGFELRSLADLGAVAVRVEGAPSPERPGPSERRAELVLQGDNRLRVAVLGGDGDRLDLELAGGARLSVDVLDLASLSFAAHASAVGFEPAPEGDRLYWARPTGFDRVDGTLEGFSAEGVAFEGVLGRRTFPWSEVAALFVEALGEPRTTSGTPGAVCVDLADGGRLHARLEGWNGDGVALSLDERRKLVLPLGAVSEVTLDDGSVMFLSSLAPSSVREGYFDADGGGERLGLEWPYRPNRAVTGELLRAGGRAWPRGLGVHAPSRLEFTLDGSWRTLRGAVAIDDSVQLLAYKGSVEFSLRFDGAAEPAWRSGRVRGGDAPIPLPPLALEGVRKLELTVDMDERSFVADRADWLRMLLIR